MKNLLILVITVNLFLVVFTGFAYSKDVQLDMLNKRADGQKMVYSEDVVKVEIGDTITWLPKTKGHNVHFIAAPDGIKKVKSKMNKKFTYTFDKPGIYLYQCFYCTNSMLPH